MPPESYQGTYAEWKYNAADPAASTVTYVPVALGKDVYATTAAKYQDMGRPEGDSQFIANEDKSSVSCDDNGCNFVYHFMRNFDGDVAFVAAEERSYDFYFFYDFRSTDGTIKGRAFSNQPLNLMLGAFYGIAATSFAAGAALLALTI